jgi:hypothetical protein
MLEVEAVPQSYIPQVQIRSSIVLYTRSLSGRIIPYFLASVLVAGEWSASRPGRFTSWYWLNSKLGLLSESIWAM